MVKTIRIKFHFFLFLIFGNSDNPHFSLIMPLTFSLFLSFSFFFLFYISHKQKLLPLPINCYNHALRFCTLPALSSICHFPKGTILFPSSCWTMTWSKEIPKEKKMRRNSILKNILPDQSLMGRIEICGDTEYSQYQG